MLREYLNKANGTTKNELAIMRAEINLQAIERRLQEAQYNNNIYLIDHYSRLLREAKEDLQQAREEVINIPGLRAKHNLSIPL